MRLFRLIIGWSLSFSIIHFCGKMWFFKYWSFAKEKNLINQIASMLRIWIRKLMTMQLIWLPILHFLKSILGKSHYKSHNYLQCHDLVAKKICVLKCFHFLNQRKKTMWNIKMNIIIKLLSIFLNSPTSNSSYYKYQLSTLT